MTAATEAPARPASGYASGLAPLSFLRLLRIELRHNAMPYLLPLIAALFWFDSYRPSTGQPPLYVLRMFWSMGQGHTIIDFGPFVAGVAAWMGSRDGRRRIADLVTGTARPRWTSQLAIWAATAIWAVAGYLVFTGAMIAAYASQGGPGAAAVVVGGGGRHGRRGVQRGRVRRRRVLAQPVRRAAGRVRRVPGAGHVVTDRFPRGHRVGADPADQLQRQLPARLGAALPLAVGPADLPDHVAGRDRDRGARPGRAARPGRRAADADAHRRGHRGRGRRGGHRGGPGQHRPALGGRHRHPRAARCGQ